MPDYTSVDLRLSFYVTDEMTQIAAWALRDMVSAAYTGPDTAFAIDGIELLDNSVKISVGLQVEITRKSAPSSMQVESTRSRHSVHA